MDPLSPFCGLCATSGDSTTLTEVKSELSKKEKLEYLIDKYINTHLLLPKSDRLCLCDTCKTRLKSWNFFIESCLKAQERIKNALCQRKNDGKQYAIVTSGSGDTSGNAQKMKRSSNYCIARWCNKGNYRGVSLFRLPKDRLRALVWLSRAERPDLKNKQNLHSYYMCANHFTPNMFTNKARNQLIRKAEPTLFPRLSLPNKMIKEYAASQSQPKQLGGVQLKSILPKCTPVAVCPSSNCNVTSNGSQTSLAADCGKNKMVDIEIHQPKNTLTIDSNISLVRTSSGFTSIPNVLYVLNSTSISCIAPNSPEDNRCQDSPSVSINENKEDKHESNNSLGASSKFSVQSNLNNMPSDVDSVAHAKVTSSCTETSEIPCISNDSTETPIELSGLLEKGTKYFLDDLGSCLASDVFNAASLLNVNDGFQESFGFRETKSQRCDKSHSKLEAMNIAEHTHSNDNHQTSTVGSQDFLLPHVCEMEDKRSLNFSEQSFPLKSDAIPDTACVASLKVSRDHPIESKSLGTGLFDLQADDIQGTDHSSYISGVDEFLDLDRYFERR